MDRDWAKEVKYLYAVKGVSSVLRGTSVGIAMIILSVSMVPPMQGVVFADHSQEIGMPIGGMHYHCYDPVTISPHQVFYQPLKVKDPQYQIPFGTSRFRCFFKDNEAALKFEVKKAWIAYRYTDGNMPVQASIQGEYVSFSEVLPGTDIQYTVESDHVLEEIILHEPRKMADLVQEIIFKGVTPVEKDGGIYFWNGEKFLFGIPPPLMYELQNKKMRCTGLHYELEIVENTYYLRKVIDEEGLTWLLAPERKYPVAIDATTQSFEDPWENSGLTPYGQYFENISEYVSPSTGSLTVKQTDFYLPGRGLDLAITRVYTTPAVFSTGCRAACAEGSITQPDYEDSPYANEYECPFTDVGNGWQLNFPWIGSEYIHFLDGTHYKKESANHTGHHFTFENNTLTTASGTEYHFTTGVLTSITDQDGNTITLGYSGGRLTTITDTLGRVINFAYNSKGQLIQMSCGSYAVTYSYAGEALASVTDPLGRVTSYMYDQRNNWLLTRISYPPGGYTDYTYSYFSQEVSPPSTCYELRKYHVTDQAVYSPDLVRHTTYTYQGDIDGITATDAKTFNSENSLQVMYHFCMNSDALVDQYVIKNTGGAQLRKVDYTYSPRKEVIKEDVYMGLTYAYTQKYVYDSWGNVIYRENGEGERIYYSYAHTDSERVFRDFNGDVPEFTNQFFDNSIPSQIHTALLGSVVIQDSRVIETYNRYSAGHVIETRQLFQESSDYSVFSGIFDENGQTSFLVDLAGVSLQGDAVLKVTGLSTPNEVTKTETHSKYKYCTWLNEGYWQQNKFYAKYVEKRPPYDTGYEPVGPFLHCPGTPGYKSYTKWVSGYNQYVKTTYTELEDKYPEQVEYRLHDWHIITENLEDRTVFCSIPVEELVSGQNILDFQEASSWLTRFEWVLYVPHAVQPTEDVSTAFSYDNYGNLVSITDALGNTTVFGYATQHAFLTSITNALGHTVTATYDFDRGFITSVTDARGNTTFFEYDILGRVTKKVYPDLSEVEAVYNDQNNRVTIYDELDHKIVRYYDGIGRITKSEWYISQTANLAEVYTYNYLNKIKTVTDPSGHVYSYEYDSLGRVVKQFNPDSTYKEVQYTDATNAVTVFDENQRKKEYHYDWVGNLLWVKEYTDVTNDYLTQYTYDSLGHLTSLTDAKGNTTSYTYDSMFGVTQVMYPDATTEIFSYDGSGTVLERTDTNGTTVFTYNALYQLTELHYPDQSLVTFEYDESGNRVLMTDPAGQSTYAYDTRNRLISETRTIEGDVYTVGYTYDVCSNLTSMTYPDQSTVMFEYDPLNRVTTIPGYAEFSYNTESLLTNMTYSNGVVTTYNYDCNDRPVTILAQKDGVNLFEMNYQYDPVSNITQLDYNRLQGEEWVESEEIFEYDWLDRLVSAQGDYGLQSYLYDSVGNRLSQNDLNYTYSNMNELLSMSDGTVFTYDGNGNTLSKSDGTNTWLYTYDKRNQLVQVEKNQQIMAQYTYDGDGRRIQKTEWIEDLQEYNTRIYIYSGLDVIYEKNVDTNQEATYVYGPTGRMAKKVGGLQDYYHADHLGSTRLKTDESGNTVTNVAYTPFGEAAVTGEEEPYLYTGKEKDSTGLYYCGARYYNSEVGRFMTRDILRGEKDAPQTLNRYVYCLNNPLKYTDPAGLDPQETVEEIFDNLLDIDSEEYAEIQALIDAKEYLDALIKIIVLLGYHIDSVDAKNKSLKVIVENGLQITIKVDEDLEDYGGFDPLTQTASINFAKTGKVEDIALTVVHEISHAVLCAKYDIDTQDQEPIIYGVQNSYMNVLWWSGVEYSKSYMDHIGRITNQYDSDGIHHVPLSKILKKWIQIQGWEQCYV